MKKFILFMLALTTMVGCGTKQVPQAVALLDSIRINGSGILDLEENAKIGVLHTSKLNKYYDDSAKEISENERENSKDNEDFFKSAKESFEIIIDIIGKDNIAEGYMLGNFKSQNRGYGISILELKKDIELEDDSIQVIQKFNNSDSNDLEYIFYKDNMMVLVDADIVKDKNAAFALIESELSKVNSESDLVVRDDLEFSKSFFVEDVNKAQVSEKLILKLSGKNEDVIDKEYSCDELYQREINNPLSTVHDLFDVGNTHFIISDQTVKCYLKDEYKEKQLNIGLVDSDSIKSYYEDVETEVKKLLEKNVVEGNDKEYLEAILIFIQAYFDNYDQIKAQRTATYDFKKASSYLGIVNDYNQIEHGMYYFRYPQGFVFEIQEGIVDIINNYENNFFQYIIISGDRVVTMDAEIIEDSDTLLKLIDEKIAVLEANQ